MAAPAMDLEQDESAIRSMFAGVASRYDLLNHLLSGGLDVIWRRRAAASLGLPPGASLLDVCCGTGDQALALTRLGYRVTAADFCLPMLTRARTKYGRSRSPLPAGLAANALALPLASARFDGVTAAFGLRNVADLDTALAEMVRVLRPGGEAAILEFALPRGRLLRGSYLLYFRRVLPRIGRMVSANGGAYSYLPASVLEFPRRETFLARMRAAGFADPSFTDLAAGIVCLYRGRRQR